MFCIDAVWVSNSPGIACFHDVWIFLRVVSLFMGKADWYFRWDVGEGVTLIFCRGI